MAIQVVHCSEPFKFLIVAALADDARCMGPCPQLLAGVSLWKASRPRDGASVLQQLSDSSVTNCALTTIACEALATQEPYASAGANQLALIAADGITHRGHLRFRLACVGAHEERLSPLAVL